jgi:transposase
MRVFNGLLTSNWALWFPKYTTGLPKYSPDLNPIEMPYSKFKTFLRKAAARTIPSLNRAIRSFIPQLSPQECANYFRHAGYVSI